MEIKHQHFDLVCIGGGGAGILAAVTAAEMGRKVAIVSKEPPGYGNTRLAVGMMSCPGVMPDDSISTFVDDISRSGEGLSEPLLVKLLGEKSSCAISRLEELGMILGRDENGTLGPKAVFLTGGHSQPRSLRNVGGGPALGAVLRAATWRYNATAFNEMAALELLKHRDQICGLLGLDLLSGEFYCLLAPAVIIATGGCGALYYPHTTNSRGTTGDGLALALKAGATLWDMEQIQFIPFGITHPPSMLGVLAGEPSTAGPAGRLLNGEGKVILEKGIHKMTRAALVRIMMEEITEGHTTPEGGLLLDLSPNLQLPKGERIYRAIKNSGIFQAVRFAYGEKAYR